MDTQVKIYTVDKKKHEVVIEKKWFQEPRFRPIPDPKTWYFEHGVEVMGGEGKMRIYPPASVIRVDVEEESG